MFWCLSVVVVFGGQVKKGSQKTQAFVREMCDTLGKTDFLE